MSKYYAIFVYIPPSHPYRAKAKLDPKYDKPVLCDAFIGRDKAGVYTAAAAAAHDLVKWQSDRELSTCFYIVEVDSEELLP